MRRIFTILITFSLIIAGLTACTKPAQPLTPTELLDLGEKYLLELNYEQALVQFTKVIEIEPMNPRGYTGAAEAYVALGQHEEAQKILQQGYDTIGSDEIKELLDSAASEMGESSEEIQSQQIATHQEEPKENPVEEGPRLPPLLDGYPRTFRTDFEAGMHQGVYYSVSGCRISEYNEYGRHIRTTLYDSQDAVLRVEENIYDEYQRCVLETNTSFSNSSVRITAYKYLDNTVRIAVSQTEHKMNENIYAGFEETIIHQMQSAGNRVEAGASYGVSGLTSIRVREYPNYSNNSEYNLVAEKEYTFIEQ